MLSKTTYAFSLAAMLGACPATLAQVATWPQFGGARRSVSLESQTLPDRFGPEKNVAWSVAMLPGRSSPCVWDSKIFLTGFTKSAFVVLCIDRAKGRELWRTEYERKNIEEFDHPASSPAAPTCATDGERVFAYFGAYGLVALDVEGEKLWEKRFRFRQAQFGHGTSPVLHKGALYLQRDVQRGSALHCFDAESGEERWVTPRPEARANFATPLVFRDELIVAGSSVVKAYKLETGKPSWWVQGLTAIVCPSPIASKDTIFFGGWSTANVAPGERLATGFEVSEKLTAEDLKSAEAIFAKLDENKDGKLARSEVHEGRGKDVFDWIDFNKNGTWEVRELHGLASFPTAPGQNILVAIKPGGEGDVSKTHVLWSKRRGIPYVATPLLYKGRLYYFKKGGFASCVDAASGESFYESKRLRAGGEYYTTPVGVGDRVFVGTERGQVLVLGLGDKLKVIAKNDFGEAVVGNPVVVENTLYLRTKTKLYAIAKREG